MHVSARRRVIGRFYELRAALVEGAKALRASANQVTRPQRWAVCAAMA